MEQVNEATPCMLLVGVDVGVGSAISAIYLEANLLQNSSNPDCLVVIQVYLLAIMPLHTPNQT